LELTLGRTVGMGQPEVGRRLVEDRLVDFPRRARARGRMRLQLLRGEPARVIFAPCGRSVVDWLAEEILVPRVETAHVGVGDAHRACGQRRDNNYLAHQIRTAFHDYSFTS